MHNIPDSNTSQYGDLHIIAGYPVSKEKFDQYVESYKSLGIRLSDVVQSLSIDNYRYIIEKCKYNKNEYEIGSEIWRMIECQFNPLIVMLLCITNDNSEEDGDYRYYVWDNSTVYFKSLDTNNNLNGWCTYICNDQVTLHAYVENKKIIKGFNLTDYLDDQFKNKNKKF